jgi:glycosyltransferase involved in cell wall biosynthesis
MKIGLVAPPWAPVPPVTYGGTESVIDNLARGLTWRGHEVTLFTVGDATCPVHRCHLFPEAVRPMGLSLPEAAHVLEAYDALADVDVLHDHTCLGPLVCAGRPIPPLVVTHHGLYDLAALRVFREVSRRSLMVAISHDQASRAKGMRIERVIHHGIDLDRYRPARHQGDHLIFIGRMSPTKGVHTAVRIAHAAGRPLRVVTKMREADELEYFRTRVRPLLSAEDEVLEELAFPERLGLLQSAVGLLDPITWPEPFGLVMAESLAVGTPVIATPLGAAPEIVTDRVTGFLCRTTRDAVRAVGQLPQIDRVACRRDAQRRFSLHRMARDHESLYLDAIERTAPHDFVAERGRGAVVDGRGHRGAVRRRLAG